MFEPPLPLLREVVHPGIDHAAATLIKKSSSPASVYRLALEGAPDSQRPQTLIAKVIAPGWPDDTFGHLRETRFYAGIAPALNLPLPRVYYAAKQPGTENTLILMEDVGTTHVFPDPTHCWTMAEIRPVVTAYARLHAHSVPAPPPAWFLPRHEMRLRETAADLPLMVQELVERMVWPPLPGFEDLLDRVSAAADQYANEPASLLHNDVFPPNAALPKIAGGDVLLFDWEMLSWGLPEMDLAYMFLQPFGSHRRLERGQVLAWYWQAREERAGDRAVLPPPPERAARQRYADELWALWLIPVAHKMAAHPFPRRTFPRVFWDAMLPLLGERLGRLSRGSDIL
ncbi:MAG: aminoglycoside phosphotransferase family protein [Candidatus Promineifilaceae bacterium]